MNPVTRISPISDAEAGWLVHPDTLTDLGDQIAATARPATAGHGHARLTRGCVAGRSPARRRLIIGLPAAGALAVAGLIAASLGSPGQKVGPVTVGPPRAQAAVMSVTRHGGYLDVIVTNPLTDARRYREVFAKLGLNITLTLVPASPSLVGTLVYDSTPTTGPQITPITAVGKCWTGGAGSVCPVGVKVPLDFKGSAVLTFARPARPGELYETTAPVTAPGEAMHGMTFVGRTAAAVIAMLAARHVTVGDYWFQNARCEGVNRESMPGSWYVTGANPWAPGEVSLQVSKTWPAPSCTAAPIPGKPAPTPTPGKPAPSASPSPAG
jgi:hypothetical protein